MKKIFKFIFILFGIFIAISVVSGIYQGVTGKDLTPKSYSYEVGYEAGISGGVGRSYATGLGSNSLEICQFLIEFSQTGNFSDFDWSSINVEDYVQGCVEGTRAAHPGGLDWVS